MHKDSIVVMSLLQLRKNIPVQSTKYLIKHNILSEET